MERGLVRPRDELHIADRGKAQNTLMRAAFFAIQRLDGIATARVYKPFWPTGPFTRPSTLLTKSDRLLTVRCRYSRAPMPMSPHEHGSGAERRPRWIENDGRQ